MKVWKVILPLLLLMLSGLAVVVTRAAEDRAQSPVVVSGIVLPDAIRYHVSFIKPQDVVIADFSAQVTLPPDAVLIEALENNRADVVTVAGDTIIWTVPEVGTEKEIFSFAFTLAVPDFFVPESIPACDLTALDNANKRFGPGTRFGVGDILLARANPLAIAQFPDSNGLRWWQINDRLWVREDGVTETGDCASLPLFDLSTGISTGATGGRSLDALPLLTSDFRVSITWSGGSVEYVGNPPLTQAHTGEGEIVLHSRGTDVELLPVANTGVHVGVERGVVPDNTVIRVRELPNTENPPEEVADDLWWCSMVEISNLTPGGVLTVLAPLRRPLPPGTPVHLFSQQADGSWIRLAAIGVVDFDGQSVAYLHPGGVIATGVDRRVQPEPAPEVPPPAEAPPSDPPPSDPPSTENPGPQRVPGGSGEESPPSDTSTSDGGQPVAERNPGGGEQSPPDSGSSGGGGGGDAVVGIPPDVADEPPTSSEPPEVVACVPDQPLESLQELAQIAVDRGLEPDPALTLIPEPDPNIQPVTIGVTIDNATELLPVSIECGTLNNQELCTYWVSVGDCLAGVEPLGLCTIKGSIACSPGQ